MPPLRSTRSSLVSLALAAASLPLASAPLAAQEQPLNQFAPAADRQDHKIDYSYFDEALRWFVIPMGPSLREAPPRREPRTGTRRIQGHESRYRLEGNRIAFAFFTDDTRASLTEYRRDLERVGTELGIARLPRNEQLAFWLNLHNVAVIEALAKEYPLSRPSKEEFGSNKAPLDDAKLVTVSGVELSPRDIRERIVYPNWSDPKVIYGFWRGEIGGPTLQRLAFNGENVNWLLSASATEFINSLRGVQNYGGSLRVSELYKESAPFHFADDAALREHLTEYAGDDVKALLSKYDKVAYAKDYELDLADMSRGEAFAVIDDLRTIEFTLGGPLQRQGESLPPNIPVSFRKNWAQYVVSIIIHVYRSLG